jgi:hypothetical protein
VASLLKINGHSQTHWDAISLKLFCKLITAKAFWLPGRCVQGVDLLGEVMLATAEASS